MSEQLEARVKHLEKLSNDRLTRLFQRSTELNTLRSQLAEVREWIREQRDRQTEPWGQGTNLADLADLEERMNRRPPQDPNNA